MTPGETADGSRGSRTLLTKSAAPHPKATPARPNPIQRFLNGAIRRSFTALPPRLPHRAMLRLRSHSPHSPTPPLSAEPSHRAMLRLLRPLDRRPLAKVAARLSPHVAWPTSVGRVRLESPLILAPGLIKGNGYPTDAKAMDAVRRGRKILSGWRSLPALLGAVEMGSFTPSARLGNSGRTLWRDTPGQSLYNRVGLRNPGAKAAARFLGKHADDLPAVYGISIAADPTDRSMPERLQKLSAAAGEFVEAGLRPAWMTLNLSCPNTEDSLPNLETPDAAGQACEAVRAALPPEVSLWAKLSPEHTEDAYAELAAALSNAGVEAVVAVNTLRRRVPGADMEAGLGGRALREEALRAVKVLSAACKGSSMQVVGCGGVSEGADLCNLLEAGASAVQYLSALVFRGPLAPVLIASEAQQAMERAQQTLER